MQDYFEVNVSLNGKHFFATAERSITNLTALKNVVSAFVLKFPASEGYDIQVTSWRARGERLTVEDAALGLG